MTQLRRGKSSWQLGDATSQELRGSSAETFTGQRFASSKMLPSVGQSEAAGIVVSPCDILRRQNEGTNAVKRLVQDWNYLTHERVKRTFSELLDFEASDDLKNKTPSSAVAVPDSSSFRSAAIRPQAKPIGKRLRGSSPQSRPEGCTHLAWDAQQQQWLEIDDPGTPPTAMDSIAGSADITPATLTQPNIFHTAT